MMNPKRSTLRTLSFFVAMTAVMALCISASNNKTAPKVISHNIVSTANVLPPVAIYSKLRLDELGLNQTAYTLAVKGWEKLKQSGAVTKDIISICDFTQSSKNNRLYIIDMATGALLFNTLVAHGKNTGVEYARYFSNLPSSLQSSLGFYVTSAAYFGKHGLGLKLEGKEPGFNDKADERAIVMHGAEYVSNKFLKQYGTLGRSWGCPAVPDELHEAIINTIKDGSCLFIYYPDKQYLANSRLLN